METGGPGMGQHGGDIYSEEIQKQIAKEDRKFLDFSANINPLGKPEIKACTGRVP